MKIYLYDDNFQFIKETYAVLDLDASRQFKTHIYSLPLNSTQKQPPLLNENESAFFIGNQWVVKKDYRGKKFFDTSLNRTVIVTELGEIPQTYIDLNSKDLINYLNTVSFENLYVRLKNKIDNLATTKLQQKVLIGKHYFYTRDIAEYINLLNSTTHHIKQLKKDIDTIEKSIQTQTSVEKINELKMSQLDKYNEIDSVKFDITAHNKRNKEVQVAFSYDEFKNIIHTLNKLISEIKTEQKNNLIKINKLSKYELVVFEQSLIQQELNYGATETKKDTKANS